MTIFANSELLENADLIVAFPPVDMQTGANTGLWVSMKDWERCLCVLMKAIGTAGDDPVFTLKQAQDAAGTGAKALNFTRVRSKLSVAVAQATIAATQTVVTQAAANTYTDTNSAEEAGFIAVDVQSADLDETNGFAYIQLSIPDIGSNAQLGGAFYMPYHSRHPQSVPASSMA